MITRTDITDITAIIIAGGKGSRLGGVDKGLMLYQQKPFIEHILQRLQPQLSNISINANRNQQQYSRYGYPVFSDILSDYQGPLAGFVTAMSSINTPYMLTLPCDAPYFPNDLVTRLISTQHQQQSDMVVVHDGERPQFMYALIAVSLYPHLVDFLQQGKRGVGQWYRQHNMALADFSDQPNAFININTEQQYQQLFSL